MISIIIISSFILINIVYSSLPISDYYSDTWEKQPYNLIDTDPVCYYEGFCPMFPPGGELSAFPNSEEKFQHILHEMARMHANDSQSIDIGMYSWGANPAGGFVWWTSDTGCGSTSATRRPLYWYSDANTAARFKQWDANNCNSKWYKQTVDGTKLSTHYTCKWGLNETAGGQVTAWGSGVTETIPENRCSLLSSSSSDLTACSFNTRSGKYCADSRDNCWFYSEGICGGNSCFRDSHCEPIFASNLDYQGKGFVEGMNGAAAIYSRFTEEIAYKLPIGVHYDQRTKVPEGELTDDRGIVNNGNPFTLWDADGKYFNLMLEYFDRYKNESATACYALYDGDYHQLDVILSNINGYSQMLRKNFDPPTSCQPYAFICKTETNNFVRLPEEDSYYFGTEWLDWEFTDYLNDYGLYCRENHYYYQSVNGEGWTVNGGPTLTKSDIWYYHQGNTCEGCQYIPILQCWEDCIRNDFATNNCNCGGPTTPVTPAPVTPSPVTPSPVTPSPTTPAPVTPAPVTPAPVTPAPVTPSPTTPAPVTPSPTTPAPVTPAPVTPAPVTPQPTTPAPVTPSPVTPSPTTPAPVTPSPVTPSPVTPSPVTPSPVTPSPTTPAPVTPSPVTPSPVTPAPVTPAPVTPSPVTPAPVTPSPVTPEPTTPAPVTPAPVTPSPITAEPTTALPTMTSQPTTSPTYAGQTCRRIREYYRRWTRIRNWDEATMGDTYLGVAEEDFLELYPDCGEWNAGTLEYFYYFWRGGRKVDIYMTVCCADNTTTAADVTFGPYYETPTGYTANTVLTTKYGSSTYKSEDSWTDASQFGAKQYIVFTIIGLIPIICCGLIIYYFKFYKKDNIYKKKKKKSNTVQMHGLSSYPGPKHVSIPSSMRDSTDGSTDGDNKYLSSFIHQSSRKSTNENSRDGFTANNGLSPPMQLMGHAIMPSQSLDTPELQPIQPQQQEDIQEPPMFSGLPPAVPPAAPSTDTQEINGEQQEMQQQMAQDDDDEEYEYYYEEEEDGAHMVQSGTATDNIIPVNVDQLEANDIVNAFEDY